MMKNALMMVLLSAAMVACSDDDGPVLPTDTGGEGSGTQDAGAEADAGPAEDASNTDAGEPGDAGEADVSTEDTGAPSCEGPGPLDDSIDTTPAGDCTADWVVFVEGTIIDSEGAPLECAFSQLCVRGPGALSANCLQPERTGPEGTFRITVPNAARCTESGAMRVLVPNASYATAYCDLVPSGEAVTNVGEVVLFATQELTDKPEVGDADAARDVVFPGGLTVSITPSEMGFGTQGVANYEALEATVVDPSDERLCFLEDTAPSRMWAFSPEANVNEASTFSFRIANDDGLAAGATVDIFVLGGLGTTLGTGEELAEGAWEVVGTATVSEDGAEIVGNVRGQGIPVFTFLGYAPQAAE